LRLREQVFESNASTSGVAGTQFKNHPVSFGSKTLLRGPTAGRDGRSSGSQAKSLCGTGLMFSSMRVQIEHRKERLDGNRRDQEAFKLRLKNWVILRGNGEKKAGVTAPKFFDRPGARRGQSLKSPPQFLGLGQSALVADLEFDCRLEDKHIFGRDGQCLIKNRRLTVRWCGIKEDVVYCCEAVWLMVLRSS
jgi:hypothetical protein